MQYNILSLLILISLAQGELYSEEKKGGNGQALLKVTVAPRAFVGREYLQLGKESEHFTVLFENISDRDIKLWGGLANAGYRNVIVRLTDDAGGISEARRAIITGSEIGDGSEIFKPSDIKILEIYPASKRWEGFPREVDKPRKFTLKIIYESTMPANDPLSWLGKIESPEYTIWLH